MQIAKGLRKSVLALSDDEILIPSMGNYGSTEIFQNSFSRLFVEYRDLFLKNEILHTVQRRGKAAEEPLSDKEFTQKHGPAPWDFVNLAMSEAGLEFTINTPDLYDYSDFEARLTKRNSESPIAFSSLSSGEKIIMSFAFCLYYATDKRQISNHPKILLLDEIDAPLHPSMSRSIISTLENIIVREYNIDVIMTTHSPTTLALSPEDSVHIMMNGHEGLRPTSKAEALNVLTEGVPTLSLSFSGRRQIFVESTADAETYALLYNILKKNIKSERSLEFISTGIKDSRGGDRNTGCDIVEKIVADVSSKGNITIFGVLDWDGKHKCSDRIAVLAEGKRNGLENVILDPLLVAAVMCRDARFNNYRAVLGIPVGLSYIEFTQWDATQLQPVVTKLCDLVLGHTAAKEIVKYNGGMQLYVPRNYLVMDDHALEAALLSKIPEFKAYTKQQAGKLMQEIIKTVVVDVVQFTPCEVMELFDLLLSKEAH